MPRPVAGARAVTPRIALLSGLQPGQVLQRQRGGARATLSGSCTVPGVVTASLRRGARMVRGWSAVPVGACRGGRFTAALRGLPVGGPFTLVLRCGPAALEIPELFVGDLWLMAGQSNMEGCARIAGAEEPHPLVRCCTMARRWEPARDPLHLKAESPDAVHGGAGLAPAAAERLRRRTTTGAGVGIPFARRMVALSGVPQGLIATAHGGTSMEQWDPRRRTAGGDSLYGSMLLSLRAVGQPLAGVLWAQGESEALPALAAVYSKRMRTLVAAVRRDLGQPRLPWLMLQAGRFIDALPGRGAWPDASAWNSVQEQQRRLPERIAHLAVVPTIDLELDDIVHLDAPSFARAADRLACCAAGLVHGAARGTRTIVPRAIRYAAAVPGRSGPRITIDFAHVADRLRSAGPVRGFALVARDGTALPGIHRVTLRGARAILELGALEVRGLRLRYGFGLDPLCTLVDARGMAVPAFGPLPIA